MQAHHHAICIAARAGGALQGRGGRREGAADSDGESTPALRHQAGWSLDSMLSTVWGLDLGFARL
eukprot:1901026-Rhodomonas_salina.5